MKTLSGIGLMTVSLASLLTGCAGGKGAVGNLGGVGSDKRCLPSKVGFANLPTLSQEQLNSVYQLVRDVSVLNINGGSASTVAYAPTGSGGNALVVRLREQVAAGQCSTFFGRKDPFAMVKSLAGTACAIEMRSTIKRVNDDTANNIHVDEKELMLKANDAALRAGGVVSRTTKGESLLKTYEMDRGVLGSHFTLCSATTGNIEKENGEKIETYFSQETYNHTEISQGTSNLIATDATSRRGLKMGSLQVEIKSELKKGEREVISINGRVLTEAEISAINLGRHLVDEDGDAMTRL